MHVSDHWRLRAARLAGRVEKLAPAVAIIVVLLTAVVPGGLTSGCAPVPPQYDTPDSTAPTPSPPPEIIRLVSSDGRILPLETAIITCEAIHPEGDTLTYAWSTSDGEIIGAGEQVEWIAPETDGLYRVFVTVSDSQNNAVSSSLGLRVYANRPPEIMMVKPDVGGEIDWFVPGTRVLLRCEAEDPDGDALSYRWSATEGEVFGEGPSSIWIAPDSLGTHWITVTVEDPFGGMDEVAIPITVNKAEPPPIYGFTLTADHGQFMRYGLSWRIYKERSCTIEAIVDDEEASYLYLWAADAGTIIADGPRAVWQAPSSGGWVTILLQVRDLHGNESSSSVRILVETCAVCM